MAKSRPSVQKRNLEARRIDKKEMKRIRRARREAEQAERAEQAALLGDEVDPDLVGIVAGPQPERSDVSELDVELDLPTN